MSDESEKKGRKRVVVEEVESSAPSEMVSSKELQTEEPEPDILDEGVKTENTSEAETKSEEIAPTRVEPIPDKKNSSIVWWIIIPGIFLLGALLGGIVFYQKGINKGEDLVATPTPSASSDLATPAPSTEIDLTKFTINILNGSGIPGEAGRAKSLLVSAGFKVSGTGNASTYNFTKTVVKAKSSVDSAFLDKLVETLSKNYSVDKTQTLPDSATEAVEVIVGSTKASE